MHIFMTGGTGFIGQRLTTKLIHAGHQLTILTRQIQRKPSQAVSFCHSLAKLPNLNGFDAVINLAGEPIFDKPWSNAQKARLIESRVTLTAQLARLIQQSEQPPHTFLSGSATGYYGDLPLTLKKADESTTAGTHFSAQLCQQWESAALQAQSAQTRVCLLRTGLPLSVEGGVLKKMYPIYRLALGGKIGSGEQHWAWIALSDYLQAVIFLLENANLQGAFNLSAPTPVTNAQFNDWLAKQCHRPAFATVPACLVKLAFGERAQLLLDNQPIIPQKLIDAGFKFQYPHLNDFSL